MLSKTRKKLSLKIWFFNLASITNIGGASFSKQALMVKQAQSAQVILV